MKRALNLVAAALVAFAIFGVSNDADALGIRLGVQAKGGGAVISNDEFEEAPDAAFDYGANVYGALAIIPKLYFGIYGDYSGATHGFGDLDANIHIDLLGFGGLFRTSWFGVTAQFYGGYAVGASTSEFEGIEDEDPLGLHGPQLGLFLGKEFILVPAVASLDIGGYGFWQNLESETVDGFEGEQFTYWTFGLGLQFNFGIGF